MEDVYQCPGIASCKQHITEGHFDLYCNREQWIECPNAKKYKSKYFKLPQKWANKKVADKI